MGSGYLRPDQFLDHLTVIIKVKAKSALDEEIKLGLLVKGNEVVQAGRTLRTKMVIARSTPHLDDPCNLDAVSVDLRSHISTQVCLCHDAAHSFKTILVNQH